MSLTPGSHLGPYETDYYLADETYLYPSSIEPRLSPLARGIRLPHASAEALAKAEGYGGQVG